MFRVVAFSAEVVLPNRVRRSSRAVVASLAPVPDPGWRRYALALAISVAMLLLRASLGALVGERLAFITFYPAVFVAAWYGGLGPTLLSTAIGVAGALAIFLPAIPVQPGLERVSIIGIAIFSITGFGTGWLGETRLRALRQADDAADQAAAEADRADAERERAEDEAAKAEEAAAEAETAAQDAAEALDRQLEAEAALRRSEQELSDFFENATIGLNWIAADGRIARANRAQLEMLGCAAADYIGHPFAEFHVEPGVAEDMLAQLRRGEVLHEVPSRMRGPGGRTRDVLVSASPHLEGGTFLHARCFVRDVTDQKQAEEAVRALQRLETVGRLAGGMAHEVNNQMTVVLGAADFILRRGDVPPVVRSDAQFIRDAAQRSAGITAQLLAFSRRQILRPEVLDLHASVAAFEPVLRRTMGAKCEVAVEPADGPAYVRVDRGQLEQVLLNLALNAADAMPQGGRLTLAATTVTLERKDGRLPLEPEVEAGEYVRLTVRDTGHGMDAATRQRIFEPFFTTKGVGKGTGLGLSTVYGIVRQSGGYIGVSSAPGQGTEFSIYLPAVARAAPAAAPRHDGGVRASSRVHTVLLVEDKPEVRHVSARALQEEGYLVLEAGDGVDALALLERTNGTVHLVLTDIALPNMDGLTLARELEQRGWNIPVLLMTGYTSAESVRQAAKDRGYRVLEKPFSADLLVSRVREALDGSADTLTPRA